MFKRFPERLTGCQFAMCNVSLCKDVVQASRNTIAPITYVPLMLFYYNGKPYARYDGPRDEESIRRFIVQAAEQAQHTDTQQPLSKKTKKRTDDMTMGVPKCEDGVCYLEFDEAYVSTDSRVQGHR